MPCTQARIGAAGPELDAPFLVGEKGRDLHVESFTKAWTEARATAGRTDLRMHDLRHSGLTRAAATGASLAGLAELGRRAGGGPMDVASCDGPEQVNQTPPSDGRAMEVDDEPEDRTQWAQIVPLNRENSGGDDGTRTHDPLLAKQVL